jgi:hypothetical protein
VKKNDLGLPPSEKPKQELLRCNGVTIHEHNFVTIIFSVDGAEMGHLHGDSIADLKFPANVSKKLVKEGYMHIHIMSFQNLAG